MTNTVDKVSVVSYTKLTEAQVKELEKVQDKAYSDRFLKGAEEEGEAKTKVSAILHDTGKKIIGFLTPQKTSWKGEKHWRSGAVYLLPEYQGKGIMHHVLKDFFAKHNPGMAWIDDQNKKSINLFTKLGFVKAKPREHEGSSGHWYILSKEAAALESIHVTELKLHRFSW